MNRVSYNDWVVDVDIEATQKYYQQFSVDNTDDQVYRNYKRYCENMPNEERKFFDSFGIDPICCDIDTLGMDRKKNLPMSCHYYVFGKYIKKAEEILIPVQELIENNFECDYPDPRINIGIFQFDFQNPEAVFSMVPKDMPNDCICIRVWIEKLPWLLDEKCTHRAFEMPRWWEIIKRINLYRKGKKLQRDFLTEKEAELKKEFEDLKITYSVMTKKEVASYVNQWIIAFAPAYANKRKQKEIYLLSSGRYSGYLWHLFSYNVLESEDETEASDFYDKIEKSDCVVFLNSLQLGFKIKNAKDLTSDILAKYGNTDIIVTAKDFSWTYTFTHESACGMCGPYFHDKNNPPKNKNNGEQSE